MANGLITVNGIEFNQEYGHAFTFVGKHSGQRLAGIRFDRLPDAGRRWNAQDIDELVAQQQVYVDDPFTQRSYNATIQVLSTEYTLPATQGAGSGRFQVELKELDLVPKVELLEIEGHQFPVLQYKESDADEQSVVREAVLQLSRQELDTLHSLIGPEILHIRRIGTDTNPFPVRCGSLLYWSKHVKNGQTYYKQVVRFVPPDFASPSIDIATGTQHNALEELVIALQVRHEALVQELASLKVISENCRVNLSREDWASLTNPSRINEISWQAICVPDAEEKI